MKISGVSGNVDNYRNSSAADNRRERILTNKLKQHYPHVDQRIFINTLSRLIDVNADKATGSNFISLVNAALLWLAQGIYPNSRFTSETNPTIIQTTISDFIKNRDIKIKAYRG